MTLTELTALSPLDGRYQAKLDALRSLLSEYGLIHHRCIVEIHWLIQLASNPIIHPTTLSQQEKKQLLNIADTFQTDDAAAIKSIEKSINHDVKAVEYFLQQKLQAQQLDRLIPLIHFGCTSEDINNLAYALMFKSARDQVLLPTMDRIITTITSLAARTADTAMLARTHGQPASPTTLGKELANSLTRLKRQRQQFANSDILGKCNGAVGNFNAHRIAYPEIDWPAISQQFVTQLGLQWNGYTTQIEPHDWLAEALHILTRFNTILIDFNRDIWGYISLDYFSQQTVTNEVGSSTMPHKVNPIDFENAEGNLGIANAIGQHLANKLPISRWQRDLSDSTVLRNLGSIFGYAALAYRATIDGLNKLKPNQKKIQSDLAHHQQVLTEAIQTTMRRYGIVDAYEQLKALSRGKLFNSETLIAFIDQLDIPNDAKSRLRQLTPGDYTGYASELVKKLL